MAITLGPNGFSSDSNTIKTQVSNTTVVENHTVAGGSTNANQRLPMKKHTPAWGGYPNGGHAQGQVWNNYTTSGNYTFNSPSSGFNAGTGRFTAPVEGTYVLSMGGISHQATNNCRYALRKNGNNNAAHCITSRDGGNYSTVCVSVTWYLALGDYVECIVYDQGRAHGGDWNYFHGYLAG